jgi:hypothetical protein
MNAMRIEYNLVTNTGTRAFDFGAIYTIDRMHASTNILINNNIVGNYGPPEPESESDIS